MLFKGLTDFAFKADAAGSLQATFSRLGVVDRDQDLTLPSAFQDGQPVPMVWAHDWKAPVGRGVVRVLPDRAVFDGRFFLETKAGEEAHATVRAMADLQEWSYGFQILDAVPGTHDGQPVRVLKSLEVFEVSPVLVGAGVGTGTDWIKHAAELEHEERAVWSSSFISSLPDSAFAVILPGGEKDDTGRTVPRSLRKLPHHGSGGAIDLPHLRNALARLPQADLPPAAAATATRHLEAHATGAGVGERDAEHLLEHIQAAVFELKVGRRFSAASRREIQAAIDALAALIQEVTADEEDLDTDADDSTGLLDPKGSGTAVLRGRSQPARSVADPSLITPAWLEEFRVRYRIGGD